MSATYCGRLTGLGKAVFNFSQKKILPKKYWQAAVVPPLENHPAKAARIGHSHQALAGKERF